MKLLIFKNNYKKTESQPDFIVNVSENEKLRKVGSLWVNTNKAGEKFMSGNIELEEKQEEFIEPTSIFDEPTTISEPITEPSMDEIPF